MQPFVLGDNREMNRFRFAAWVRGRFHGPNFGETMRIHAWVLMRIGREMSCLLPTAFLIWKLMETVAGEKTKPVTRHLISVGLLTFARNISYFYF